MTEDPTRKVAELLNGERFGMLTTHDSGGTMISRPMAMQQVEFDGDLWFFASSTSRKVAQLTADPHVNVTVSSADTWVSLTGTAAVVTDDAKKKELWNSGIAAWFPDGPDDDEIVLIKVDGNSAEYWDTPGGRVATALSLVKAKVTGQRYSGGDNDQVDLP